jgi:hypothetical protein
MTDDWEDAKGLNKASPADAQLTTVDGKYPNIEVYLNSLVATITENQLKDALATFAQESSKPIKQVQMYLDHNTGLLKVKLDEKISRTEILTATGTLIKNQKCCQSFTEVDVKDLKPGIYIVRNFDENQNGYCGKFIIR